MDFQLSGKIALVTGSTAGIGLALHEPIARYGPFVMNTEEEIEQTLLELRGGTFVTT